MNIVDLLGARTRIIACSGMEARTEEVVLPHDFASPSTMLLPTGRGDHFSVGQTTHEHRRGRALAWPPEAQSPPAGNPANGNGRVYAEAVLRSISSDRLADRQFVWRPDGRTEIAVSAEVLLGESIKHFLSQDGETGLVVPDGMEERHRQALLDACAPHGKVWLIPRGMAAAIAWCRSEAAKPLLVGQSNEDEPIGHIILVEAGLGPWAVSGVPIFRISRGKKTWLMPKRLAGLRRTVHGLSGWGLLARQAGNHHGRPALTRLHDTKWVMDILDGEQALVSDYINRPMPGRHVLPKVPGFSSGHEWDAGLRALVSEINTLRSELTTNCIGGEAIGALAWAKKQGGYLREQLQPHYGAASLNLSDSSVSKGAALAMVGKANGTPTWFENLETIHLFFKDKNELGDPIPGWEALLPGKQMDAGRDYQSEQPIEKFSIPAGRNTITLTLKHTQERGLSADYRKSTTAQSQVCEEETPILITVHAKPGQGFAVVTVKSKRPGLFSGKLDWLKMEKCDEPTIKHGYTPTAKLVAVDGFWPVAREQVEALISSLRHGESREGLLDSIKRLTGTMNRCVHSEANLPDRWKVQGQEKGHHIYYTPVTLQGSAPNLRLNARLNELHGLLIEQITLGADGHTLMQIKVTKKLRSAAARLMAWRYHGCPRDILEPCINRVAEAEKLSVLDLHVLGLALEDRREILSFMHRLRDVLPGMSAANNWLRAFRNIVRLNEHALRDVSDEDAYVIVDALLEKLADAVEERQKTVASNCLESLLFALKRRRYSPGFMAKDENRAHLLMMILNSGEEVEEDGPGYSRRTLRFMAEKNLKFAGSLVKFLREDATNEDITITSSMDDESEDGEDE